MPFAATWMDLEIIILSEVSLICSFSTCMPLFFSCLMILAKTSYKMLNRIAECKHSYLDPCLEGSLQSLFIKYDISCRFFVHVLYTVLLG